MEENFHLLLYRAFHGKRNYMRPYLAQAGLGPGQPKLLEYAVLHGPCRQRQLAEQFDIDPAAVSRMLDSLEKGGFITRQADENCRRAGLITATDKGRAAAGLWQRHCAEAEELMLAGFSEGERAQFLDFLARAGRNITRAAAERGQGHA